MSLVPLRDRILGSLDSRQPAAQVEVPEWGVTVGIRRMSVSDRLVFEATNGTLDVADRKKDPEQYHRWILRYVMATVCTLEGEPVFRLTDEEALREHSYSAIERLALAAIKVNSVSQEEIESLGKRSSEAQNGALPSGSPATSGGP